MIAKRPTKTFLIASVVVAFIAIILVSLHKYALDSPYRISSTEAKKRIAEKKIDIILDARTDWELTTFGAYPGSLHIQNGDINTKQLPDKKARVLVFCNIGHTARVVADKLHTMGYKNTAYTCWQV